MSTKHYVDEPDIDYCVLDRRTKKELDIVDIVEGYFEKWYVCRDRDTDEVYIRAKRDFEEIYYW